MEQETFEAFQQIAYSKAGIFLRPGKAALVQARLAKRLRELGLASEKEYLERLRGDEGEAGAFVDALGGFNDIAHIVGDSGKAEQTALAVEDFGDLGGF